MPHDVVDVRGLHTAVTRMTRAQKLDRWATLLERHEGPIFALESIEYLSIEERDAARAGDSPLSVARKDPVLASEGLKSDRFGDGMTFFEISDDDAHFLLCSCHYQDGVSASDVASRIRLVASGR